MSEIGCVFDANVVMAMLIGGKSWWLTFVASKKVYTPDYIFDELDRHEPVIRMKTKFSDVELARFTIALFEQIIAVPRLVIAEKSQQLAQDLCTDVDVKDASYVALSLQLGFPLITRDKPLFTGLRKKGFRDIILFEDYLQLL